MTIIWYGYSCFKITNSGGQLTIIVNPFDRGLGLTPPRGGTDIVLVSAEEPEYNNVKSIAGEPFIINGPGEYEIKGIKIIGLNSFSVSKTSQEKSLNTIYLIEVDKVRICHLGNFNQERLTDEQLDEIGEIDILMVPVGGGNVLGAEKAAVISEQLEPNIIIPVFYHLPGIKTKLASVDEFLKEMGAPKKQTVDKLTLKKKDLVGKEGEVLVMKP